jgi:hypothetical protein
VSSVAAENAQRAGLTFSDRLARPTFELNCPGSVGPNSTRIALCERRRKLCGRCYRAMSLRLFAAPRGPRGMTCQLATLQKGFVEFSWLNPPVRKTVLRAHVSPWRIGSQFFPLARASAFSRTRTALPTTFKHFSAVRMGYHPTKPMSRPRPANYPGFPCFGQNPVSFPPPFIRVRP